MPLMSWNEKMSVGIASIDLEHQKLVAMLNSLFDGIQAGQGPETLSKVLDGLISYTAAHFRHEEEHFVATGYPAATSHKKEHDELTQQVLDVQAKYQAGNTATLSLEVMNFLKNWLVNHIQGSDKAYRHHLIANGVR